MIIALRSVLHEGAETDYDRDHRTIPADPPRSSRELASVTGRSSAAVAICSIWSTARSGCRRTSRSGTNQPTWPGRRTSAGTSPTSSARRVVRPVRCSHWSTDSPTAHAHRDRHSSHDAVDAARVPVGLDVSYLQRCRSEKEVIVTAVN